MIPEQTSTLTVNCGITCTPWTTTVYRTTAYSSIVKSAALLYDIAV